MEGNLKKSIAMLAVLATTSLSFAQYNTSPELVTIDEYRYEVKELEQKKFLQFRVTDLLNHLESTDRNVLNIEDAESTPFIVDYSDSGLEVINNMGIALVHSQAAAAFNIIEVMHPDSNAWEKLSDLSESAGRLLKPKSIIRLDLSNIPMTLDEITLKFKLWDMSDLELVDLDKKYDTTIPGNDSPFSKDTQVVYVKIPWDLFQ